MKQAIEYEIERQKEILEKGETPMQETRGYDEKKGITYSQRSKEEAQDYRYFPEPDIPPFTFSKKYIDSIIVPELPGQKLVRYIRDFWVKEQDAFVLTRDKNISYFFEKIISNIKNQISKLQIKDQKYEQAVVNLIINKKVSTDLSVEQFLNKVIEILQPKNTDIRLLDDSIIRILGANKKVVGDYKKGKTNALMFLVGQVMKELKGKADAKIAIEKLKEKLK